MHVTIQTTDMHVVKYKFFTHTVLTHKQQNTGCPHMEHANISQLVHENMHKITFPISQVITFLWGRAGRCVLCACFHICMYVLMYILTTMNVRVCAICTYECTFKY